jgi:nucleoside-diphosphate-sugar epimerase
MKVLVTGGCGYLGSVIVKKLVSKGHDTTIFDSLLFGSYESKVPIIAGDITDNTAVSKALEGKDVVIHLAGIVGEGACLLNNDHTVKVNYLATRNLAKMCEERKLRLVLASTASVYGSMGGSMLDEKSELFPVSVYAITKLAAEDAVRSTCTDHVIFRQGTLFGCSPRMRFDLVVNTFVAMAASKETLLVFGGSQIRPFLHLEDAADAFVRAAESRKTGLFNLGGNNYRIIDVANFVADKMNAKVNVYPELVDRRDYCLDSRLAADTFGVTFSHTVENSIQDIFELPELPDWRNPRYSNEKWLKPRLTTIAKSTPA